MASPNPYVKVWFEPMAIERYERESGLRKNGGKEGAPIADMEKELLLNGEFYRNDTFPGPNGFYCKVNGLTYKGFKPNGELRIVAIVSSDKLKERLAGCERIDVKTWYPEMQKYRDLEGKLN